MSFNFLNRVKVAVKMFIAPAVLIAIMLFQGAEVISSFKVQAETAIELRDVDFKKISIVREMQSAVTQIHFDMYQLFTVYSYSSSEKDRIAAFEQDVKKQRTILETKLAEFQTMKLDDYDKSAVGEVIKAGEKYKKAVDEVLGMMAIDTAMAYMYQNEMNFSFEDLDKKLAGLSEDTGMDVGKSFDNTVSAAESAKDTYIVILISAVLLGLVISFIMSKVIAGPIIRMTSAMNTLAGGDTNVEIPARDNKDEIGNMAKAVEVFKQNAIRARELEEEQKVTERRAVEEKKATMKKLADDFESSVMGIVNGVSAAATQLNGTAGSMTHISEETSQQATAVAAASEQAAVNVQTVAAAAEELSHSIGEIARRVSEESQIARDAVKIADETAAFIAELAEASKKIGEVVELINDIAGQTNLLALNATIEAARAGEAGKGFAVVANEVKNLATETAKATDAISGQIADVQNKTNDAVEAIKKITEVIKRIDEISGTITDAVDQQGKATQEISKNVEQAAAGTKEVSSNINGVTTAAGQAGSAASEVASSSLSLAENAAQLKNKVNEFITRIRQG